MGELGGPAEAERAVDQDLVAADRDVGADLEVDVPVDYRHNADIAAQLHEDALL
jgi:hypothetical protein